MGWGSYAQAVLALVFVLALIGLLTVLARRFGIGSPAVTMGHKNKRVQIVEVTPLDARRRLVLVRRDDREHLILLGSEREQVVESNILSGPSFAATLSETVDGGGNKEKPGGDPT